MLFLGQIKSIKRLKLESINERTNESKQPSGESKGYAESVV
jgi:hypothetical protein